MSPSASWSAALQSIIPAPVRSRRALTSLAEMAAVSAIGGSLLGGLGGLGGGWLGGGCRGGRWRCRVGGLVLRGRRGVRRGPRHVVGGGRRHLGVGALGHDRVGRRPTALLHGLCHLGLGGLAVAPALGGDQRLLACGLLGLAGGLLGLLAREALCLLARGELLGLAAGGLLLGT